MNWKTDEEVTELINSISEQKRSRVTITRWRTKARHPKYEEREEIEKVLGFPFDVFYKDIDFDKLITKLEKQLIEVNKLKAESETRIRMNSK